ncbi:MAG: hypothetical protein OXI13_14355, partial [Gammaproteobacteria bacterium]|nr:hypothetical protein [Gammaproteobacteria bacterium]
MVEKAIRQFDFSVTLLLGIMEWYCYWSYFLGCLLAGRSQSRIQFLRNPDEDELNLRRDAPPFFLFELCSNLVYGRVESCGGSL